jgi:hypothetical protein
VRQLTVGIRPRHWAIALVAFACILLVPYVIAGADDFEEYFTSVVTTRVAFATMLNGGWPLWSVDFGLGAPQPLRFHFITHPLAPLCVAVTDCHALLRAVASLHVLLGAFCIALLTLRLTARRSLALTAGLTYCLSSSVVQPLFTDDWPITAINESALVLMLYAVVALCEATRRREALLWTLVLGGVGGYILSTSFPVVSLVAIAVVALCTPGGPRRLPWLVLAAAITLLMGVGQVHHIYEQLALTPSSVVRRDHVESPLAVGLWSTFVRPLFGSWTTWRTVFFGPPLAIAAVSAAFFLRDIVTRPLVVGLLLGVAGLLVPPEWLLNINTAQWTYRTELNVFGILLGAYAVDRWAIRAGRPHVIPAFAALQLTWMAVAVFPVWSGVSVRALELVTAGDARHTKAAEQIVARHAARPGRVAFSPKADPIAARREGLDIGILPNELQLRGVPSVSAILLGLTLDPLYPTEATLESETKMPAPTAERRPSLDVLGIRYVVAMADEAVAPGLHDLGALSDTLRLYENPTAWPEAFFVDRLPAGRVPRLADCANPRFLCADFAAYDFFRTREALEIARMGDGYRLTFAPSAARRHLVVTQWYQPGWTVTEGRGSVAMAAEQLVGVDVEPGERSVTVRFRPPLRVALFTVGILTEATVGMLLVALLVLRRQTAH